jgi:hypothetical protein
MLSNPIIEQCVRRFLGPAYCRYWCGNTACPGSGVQPLHADGGGWSVKSKAEAEAAGVAWPHPNYMLSVNFGIDDMTPANGSTEVRLSSGPAGECNGPVSMLIRDSRTLPRTGLLNTP